MKDKKNIIKVISLLFLILTIFFTIYYKTKNNWNNNNKSINDLKEYILNISSYEAELEVTVYSNKTTNKYKLKQLYCKPNFIKQVVKEPSNIENLTIIYDGNSIKIENTNLSLSKIYKDYKYINENTICLNPFIDNYNYNSKNYETENEYIFENYNDYNNYNVKQKLYIDKNKKVPIKMEIYDNNKNIKVYIKYNEIKLNKLTKKQILE